MRRAVKLRLLLRWARVIEEDVQTEGFWEEVAAVSPVVAGVSQYNEDEIRRWVLDEADRFEHRAGGRP